MKFSIITTTFNSEKYIGETLESIKENSRDNDVEHIVVDAGSTDETKRIVKSFGLSAWYDLEGSTMYEAIDFGFKKSTGEIFCWLNSDDLFLPNTLSLWNSAFLKNEGTKIVTGGTVYIDELSNALYRYNWTATNIKFIQSFKTLMLCQPSTCWRREVYFELGGLNLAYKITADRDFFIRAIRKYGIARNNTELTKFRVHNNNLSRLRKELALEENLTINQELKAGPTSLNRKLLQFLGHIIVKVCNIEMILWKIKHKKGNLFHS